MISTFERIDAEVADMPTGCIIHSEVTDIMIRAHRTGAGANSDLGIGVISGLLATSSPGARDFFARYGVFPA